MFNKSALLIIVAAAFAVALPTGSIDPNVLGDVNVLGVSVPITSDVNTPSANHAGISGVRKVVRHVAHPSLQLPQSDVEKVKAPAVPHVGKTVRSVPAVSFPRGETLVDELANLNLDASTASVLQNPSVALPKIPRTHIPVAPHDFSQAKGKLPKAETTPITARAQPNTASENPDVSHIQSTVEGVKAPKVLGALNRKWARKDGIPGFPSTHKLTQSSSPRDLKLPSFATNTAGIPTDLENASFSNVKSPSLARRAESCASDYTLTYCMEVLQAGDSFISQLLETIHVDTAVTGLVGLACSAAKTTDYTHPLCSKKLDVQGLALNCVDAIVNSLN